MNRRFPPTRQTPVTPMGRVAAAFFAMAGFLILLIATPALAASETEIDWFF